MKSHRWTSGRVALAVVLFTVLDIASGWAVRAQTAPGNDRAAGWLPVEAALKTTLQSGRPSVLVFTLRSGRRRWNWSTP